MTTSDVWDAETADRYDTVAADRFADHDLRPTVDYLAELAGNGPVLEFAVGTGRVAIPLAERGLDVRGIELSAPMAAKVREKVGDAVPVTVGDMATTTVGGSFSLVYLVWNTIGNLCTQDEQVACFRNAAAHLRPGGHFVVEMGVPTLRRSCPGQLGVPFDVSDEHVGLDTMDVVTQRAVSHHFTRSPDGSYRRGTHNHRYVWPSELDLMARLAGLSLHARHADWRGGRFTAASEAHVSAWRKGTHDE